MYPRYYPFPERFISSALQEVLPIFPSQHLVRVLILLAFLLLLPHPGITEEKIPAADLIVDGQQIDLKQEKFQILFQELEHDHGFSKTELDALFQGVTLNRRVLVLMDKQWEAKPYFQYRPLFITDAVIKKGKNKLQEHKEILDRIEQELGVDREVVIAIWGIESHFGSHTGGYGVFQTLTTLFDAYPRRSAFFRKQLLHFLLLCRENDYDPLVITGSYAGAFGQTQFIPSSFREYAVSFDGDARRDVFGSIEDILASIANYLHRYHWVLAAPLYIDIGTELKSPELVDANIKGRKGLVDWQQVSKTQGVSLPTPPDNSPLTIVSLEKDPTKGGGIRYVAGYPNFQAITQWNNSNRYAMAVSELAEAIKLPKN
ncbi:MAG: lytic murein transglycosylase [Proteobacteria bacterium]|nr:lytic murein transglycosylase [Pseudomonadota bacterium]MBU1233401.1 lytic murein transglycosylase [Pseudomonadota bacterium]MBU1417276.1 lytic murein transglycosylase [Pseudomonadota bacterium]MBU1453981.1 lytic murein transglycosylase [Pseudomonadota bacterium]